MGKSKKLFPASTPPIVWAFLIILHYAKNWLNTQPGVSLRIVSYANNFYSFHILHIMETSKVQYSDAEKQAFEAKKNLVKSVKEKIKELVASQVTNRIQRKSGPGGATLKSYTAQQQHARNRVTLRHYYIASNELRGHPLSRIEDETKPGYVKHDTKIIERIILHHAGTTFVHYNS